MLMLVGECHGEMITGSTAPSKLLPELAAPSVKEKGYKLDFCLFNSFFARVHIPKT